jgi:hypothetical protein
MLSRIQSSVGSTSLITRSFGLNNVLKAAKPWFSSILKLDPVTKPLNFPFNECQSLVQEYSDQGYIYTAENQVSYTESISSGIDGGEGET